MSGAGARRAQEVRGRNNSPPYQGGPPGRAIYGGGYDGPGSVTSNSSRGPPQDGPPQDGSPRPNPFGQGLGFDPAKPAAKPESIITNTRVELPAAAYALDRKLQGVSDFQAYYPALLSVLYPRVPQFSGSLTSLLHESEIVEWQS